MQKWTSNHWGSSGLLSAKSCSFLSFSVSGFSGCIIFRAVETVFLKIICNAGSNRLVSNLTLADSRQGTVCTKDQGAIVSNLDFYTRKQLKKKKIKTNQRTH
jgi:hypothetical protein